MTKQEGEKPPLQPQQPEPKNSGDSPAPDNKREEAIRNLQDLLRSGKDTSKLEAETGMTRQEMEQFVKKFEKTQPKPPVREGQELKGDVTKDKTLDPNRKIANPTNQNIERKIVKRGAGANGQDQLAGDAEGGRTVAPPDYYKRYEAYRKSLSKPEK